MKPMGISHDERELPTGVQQGNLKQTLGQYCDYSWDRTSRLRIVGLQGIGHNLTTMIRLLAIACIFTGLSLPSRCIAGPVEQMSGTSFNSTRTQQQDNLAIPLLSLAGRAGLLGLGLVAVRRVAFSSK
jgi:hypothetical protein